MTYERAIVKALETAYGKVPAAIHSSIHVRLASSKHINAATILAAICNSAEKHKGMTVEQLATIVKKFCFTSGLERVELNGVAPSISGIAPSKSVPSSEPGNSATDDRSSITRHVQCDLKSAPVIAKTVIVSTQSNLLEKEKMVDSKESQCDNSDVQNSTSITNLQPTELPCIELSPLSVTSLSESTPDTSRKRKSSNSSKEQQKSNPASPATKRKQTAPDADDCKDKNIKGKQKQSKFVTTIECRDDDDEPSEEEKLCVQFWEDMQTSELSEFRQLIELKRMFKFIAGRKSNARVISMLGNLIGGYPTLMGLAFKAGILGVNQESLSES